MHIVVLVLLLSVLPMLFCHWYAARQGANPVFWGVLGAVLGPISLFLVIFLAGRKQEYTEK